MKWTLRGYQREFCRAVVDSYDGRVNNERFEAVLATAATGAGKTIMASCLIWFFVTKRSSRVLFLADTDELVSQAAKKIHQSTGLIPDIEKAAQRASMQSDVVVSSIQSMSRRLKKFPANHFHLVIADEAHLSMAPNWQKVLSHFRKAGGKILGITATPERSDKKSLMRFYQHLAYEIPLSTLIEARHLSPITVQTCPIEIPITSKISAGDSDSEALGDEIEPYWDKIIGALKEHGRGRRAGLIFHPSCKASAAFSKRMMEHGESSAHVDGNSPDRKELIEGFSQGRFKWLNNAQLLQKGFDCDRIDIVSILSPMRSRSGYIQRVGRGTRLFCPHGCVEWCDHGDRKQDMLLLDFLWEFQEHDVMGPADLLTDMPEQKEEVARRLKKGDPMDLLDTGKLVVSEREQRLIDKLKRVAGGRSSRYDASTFAAMMHTPALLDYEPVAAWQENRVSDAQRDMLEKCGVDPDGVRDRGHASAIIDTIIGRREKKLATPKQVYWLLMKGVPDAHSLTFDEASEKLDELMKR